MMNWLLALFKSILGLPQNVSNKYRLEPDDRGTYTLQRYDDFTSCWDTVSVSVRPEEADERIKSLEREAIYYREDRK